MSTLTAIQAAVAQADTQLLDWFQSDVIACNQLENGWEIWFRGLDNEPATEEPLLFKTQSFREAIAQAKERQLEILAPNLLKMIESRRVEDAGGD